MTAHRVLWLTKGLGLGGAERLVASMAPRLSTGRYTVDVAYMLPWKDALVGELHAAGIETRCLGARRTVDVRWVRALGVLLRERDYDLVHTHSPVPAAAARLLRRSGTNIIHTEHNVWERYRAGTYAINAMTLGRCAHVYAVSDQVAASIQRPTWLPWGQLPPVETLLHGVDAGGIPHGPEARATARAALGVAEDVPLIACVANLTPKKDHDTLLAAMVEIRRRSPTAALHLIGTGPLEDQLRDLAARRGLGDCVTFHGARSDVPVILPGFDVFVLSSRYEGLPISLLEAMAAGVAAVSTAAGGVPEVITDDTVGRLVPVAAPGALAEAVTTLLASPTDRAAVGRAGRERVMASFSLNSAIRRTRGLYDAVLAATGGREG